MAVFWLILFFVLLVIEIMTINLVSIWFAIGSLVSCIVSLFTKNVNIQILVFAVVSVIVLLIMKPFVKSVRSRKIEPTNLDRIVGKIGVVTDLVKPLENGEIKVDGKKWTAVSKKELAVGTRVKILKIDGVKAIVEEFKED